MSSQLPWLVSLSPSPPFTNISPTESWSILSEKREMETIRANLCKLAWWGEVNHMVRQSPRVQSPVITAMWVTGAGSWLELTQSSDLSTVHITASLQLLNIKFFPGNTEPREWREWDFLLHFVTEFVLFLHSVQSLKSFDVWYCVLLCWCLICDSDDAGVVCNYPKLNPRRSPVTALIKWSPEPMK